MQVDEPGLTGDLAATDPAAPPKTRSQVRKRATLHPAITPNRRPGRGRAGLGAMASPGQGDGGSRAGEIHDRGARTAGGGAGRALSGSPFLSEALGNEPSVLRLLHEQGPDEAALRLSAELAAVATDDRVRLMAGLRRARRRHALLIGLCDLEGLWPLEQVTEALTTLADRARSQLRARPTSLARPSGAARSRPASRGQRRVRARHGQARRWRAELSPATSI